MKELAKRILRYNEIRKFIEKHERFLIPGMLLVGVAADFVTFKSLKLGTAFLILGVYFVIAGATVAYINFYDSKRIEKFALTTRYVRLISPLVLQFTFGALLSASLVFYWFSGSFSVSWPFFIVLAILMTSNEIFRDYFQKPIVQICVYFFISFSLLSIALPFLFNSINSWVFVTAGIISLAIIFVYVTTISKIVYSIKAIKPVLFALVFFIFSFMNFLYFFNIIPPIPLSLRDRGVYHGIERSGGDYVMLDEKTSIIDKLIPGETIHVYDNGVYVFTSIFAPTDLNTTVIHHWEYYDKTQGQWMTSSKMSYSIFGGREDGYRGYSVKSNPAEGAWRVSVETERGQIIGRVKFMVQHVEEAPELIEIIK